MKERGQDIPESRCYTGFDAYQKLIASDVDVVLQATPPHFRPMHMAAVIDAKKHLFMEKPVAVDVPGVMAVMQTAERASSLGLSIMTGTQLRRELPRHRGLQARARRRHRRDPIGARDPQPGRALVPRAAAGLVRHGVHDPRLGQLGLALGRHHRRAAHPPSRRDAVDPRQAAGLRGRHGRARPPQDWAISTTSSASTTPTTMACTCTARFDSSTAARTGATSRSSGRKARPTSTA